jgi:hypothetical protein
MTSNSPPVFVVLTGWRSGLRKVAPSRLLRTEADLPLSQAQDAVARLLDGQPAWILAGSRERVERIATTVRQLGATVATVER